TRMVMQSRQSSGWPCTGTGMAASSAKAATGSKPRLVCVPHRSMRSVRVFRVQQPDRRHQDDVDIEQDRPVLDVVEVVVHALHDLVERVGFATPAIDLGPAGHPGLYPVPGKIALNRF